MQSIVRRNQGYRRQYLVDDKGAVLIVVFGVPPFSHEDNAYRAVKTALAIQKVLSEQTLEHSIGIATGNVYVGVVGSDQRREHAVVGDTVNTSARLSGKANGSIYVDESTCKGTHGKIGRAVQQECRDRSRMPSSA
eukprot:TRINITY_DN20687_c0_g1_i1.p1 TRINITY_DN20687_c0_g1~~TRINITY_DN20687_c0_g1_i1.p1  ORF type:complete len:136 (+),score=21.01 TRINITY_DN20687_c0_g1_i1:174-581(+)